MCVPLQIDGNDLTQRGKNTLQSARKWWSSRKKIGKAKKQRIEEIKASIGRITEKIGWERKQREINHRWLCGELCTVAFWWDLYLDRKCVRRFHFLCVRFVLSYLPLLPISSRSPPVRAMEKSFLLNVNTRNLGILLDFIMLRVCVLCTRVYFDLYPIYFVLFDVRMCTFCMIFWCMNTSRMRSIMIILANGIGITPSALPALIWLSGRKNGLNYLCQIPHVCYNLANKFQLILNYMIYHDK